MHRHHRPMVQQCPTNKISAYPHESQVPLCIHFVRASLRAQTGIVQPLLSEAARRKWKETASQNKRQRSSLSCWCLHRLSGNRTIQVHTLCFSVVAFMCCHQWCLSHLSSWISTTHRCSFEQLKNRFKSIENTHQQAGQTRSVRPAFPVLEGQTSYKGSIIRTMWNSAQPLSLSAKIFLHHRQRLCFAFAHSQCHKQKQH